MWFQTPAENKVANPKKVVVAPGLPCRPEDRCAVESESLANEFKKLVPPKPPASFTTADDVSMKFIRLAVKGEVSESALATYVSAALESGKRKSSYMFNLAAHLDKSMTAYAPFSAILQKELANAVSSPTARGFCAYALGIIKETQALPEIKNQFSSSKLPENAARLFADGLFRIEPDGGFLVDYVRRNYKGAQTEKEQIPLISSILVTIYNGTSPKVNNLLSELALDKTAPEAMKPFAYKYAGTTGDDKKYGDALEAGLQSKDFQAGYEAALALGQFQLQPSTRDKATERIVNGLRSQEVRDDVKAILVSLVDSINPLDRPIMAVEAIQCTRGGHSPTLKYAAYRALAKLQPNEDNSSEALKEFGNMDPESMGLRVNSLTEFAKKPLFKTAIVELKNAVAGRAQANESEKVKLREILNRLEARYPKTN